MTERVERTVEVSGQRIRLPIRKSMSGQFYWNARDAKGRFMTRNRFIRRQKTRV